MLLGCIYREIDHLALFAPSAYVFAGVNKGSSWRIGARSLPAIDFFWQNNLYAYFHQKEPLEKRFSYASDHHPKREAATIPA